MALLILEEEMYVWNPWSLPKSTIEVGSLDIAGIDQDRQL